MHCYLFLTCAYVLSRLRGDYWIGGARIAYVALINCAVVPVGDTLQKKPVSLRHCSVIALLM